MRKLWTKVKALLRSADTREARKSVASDLKKASTALFFLFLGSLPGTYHGLAVALAAMLGAAPTAFVVSTGTAIALLLAALAVRVVAFFLECDYKDPGKPPQPPGKPKKKSKSRTTRPNEADDE